MLKRSVFQKHTLPVDKVGSGLSAGSLVVGEIPETCVSTVVLVPESASK